ncbi:argonaute-like protein [Crepidotus variabilis]|uniref:Argonaute-like protein n=1 Tax=Crepidotus variabilis TaxID=179855 RepID=A0A9P6EF91_9AGAR|nr:argonaute-like protein [Crepidotus variabilis]
MLVCHVIVAHVQTIGVKRPAFGTSGRQINVIVNAFKAEVANGNIYQYDVVTPDKLPPRLNYKLFKAMHEGPAANTFRSGPMVYDGRKIAFSSYELPFGQSAKFDVSLPHEGPPSTRPPKVYEIKLSKAAEINTEILRRFVLGQQTQDTPISTALSALNVALRMDPNLKYPFNTRSFFTEKGKKDIKAGLELWQGYFQSLRPSQNMLYVNIDISTGVMYKAGRLPELCLEYLRKPDVRYLGSIVDRERIRLQKFYTNVRFETKYARRQVLSIKKISKDSARSFVFTLRDGTSTTVENYFRTTHNVTLQFPTFPCVEVGSGALIPLELCHILPGQLCRRQFPEDKTSEMVDFARKPPQERLAAIREGLQVLEYGQSEYVRAFGLNISQAPMTIKARVLGAPTLQYGQGSRQADIAPRNGSWNLIDKKLFKAETVRRWAVVIFESPGRFNMPTVQGMIRGFIEGARACGMAVLDENPFINHANPHTGVANILRAAGASVKKQTGEPPNLIVVVLPEDGNIIYTAVKHFGDVQMGVATQCLKANKCGRAKPQYWGNVMLKVNAKLGGINAILKSSPLNDPNNPTIVLGADVIHPAPGADGRPSFTSLVSSVDSNTAKYIATSRVQEGRVEMIADLEEMVKNALTMHAGYRTHIDKLKPGLARLIFYRDGVSEGQFQQVLQQELPAIKAACTALNLRPKITLIVVGKRHHIRMFPQNPGDADPKSGNLPAGTTIDDGLGHPTENDYYQLTHGGLIGTSRPAHYSVLYDDSNFSVDALQSLSFALCHVYARATRSVSIPAPVYYADIVCSRAKNHFAPDANLESTEVESMTSEAATNQLARFKAEYKPLHQNISRSMYFM